MRTSTSSSRLVSAGRNSPLAPLGMAASKPRSTTRVWANPFTAGTLHGMLQGRTFGPSIRSYATHRGPECGNASALCDSVDDRGSEVLGQARYIGTLTDRPR